MTVTDELVDQSTASEPATFDDVSRRQNREWWRLVGLIALLGLAMRVWYILTFRQDPFVNQLPSGQLFETTVWGDGLVFHKQANMLADGEGLISPLPFELQGIRQQSADHPPVYTLFLTAFSFLGVRSELGHMLVSAPLGALTAVVFGLLGRRVGGMTGRQGSASGNPAPHDARAGYSVGLIAAAFGALDPNIWPYPGFVLSETVTIPLAGLVALFCYRCWESPSAREAVGLGVVLGLAILARAELAIVAVVGVVPFMMLLPRITWTRRIALLALAGVVSSLLVLPWVGYNLNRFDEPVYLSIGLDYSLVQGNCDESYDDDLLGYYWLACQSEALEGTGLDVADQAVGSLRLREVAFDYIADHPSRASQAVAARVGRIAGVFHPLQQARLNAFVAGREPWLANAAVLTYYPMAILSFFGASILRRRGVPLLPLLGLVLTSIIAVAMTLAVLRYRASAQPVLAVLSAVAINHVLQFVRRARGTATTPTPVTTSRLDDHG